MKHAAAKIGFWLVLVLLMLAEYPSGHASSDTIRIGEIDPLTGKLAQHGQEIHEGILYAVEEVNSRGGIKGRKVELISRDDQSQPEVAINQAEDLLYREKVVGLVGGYVDSLVGPISELAAKHRTPYVASASLQRGLTLGRENPFFFRVAHLDGILEPLCSFIADRLNPRKAAILFTATPGSTEIARDVRTCLQTAGIEIPIFEKFRPGCPDFSSFLLKLRQAKVEILISGGFLADHLILVRQIREQNIPIKSYIGPWGIAYHSFIEALGESSEGLFGMCAWNPGITLPGTEEASATFQRRFLSRFGRVPNTTTMHGYTSAKALLRAIAAVLENDNDLTGENISGQLRSLDLILPMEHLLFDEKGDPRHYHQVIVQIQNGQMVTVHPPERATGQIADTNAR